MDEHAELRHWADAKITDSQGKLRMQSRELVALGCRLQCFSEKCFRQLVAQDRADTLLLAFEWLDSMWNGRRSDHPRHFALCSALLERAFALGVRSILDSVGLQTAAAEGLASAECAKRKMFQLGIVDPSRAKSLEISWGLVLELCGIVRRADSAHAPAYVHLISKSIIEAGVPINSTSSPMPSLLDDCLPALAYDSFKEATRRDARADALGTSQHQLQQQYDEAQRLRIENERLRQALEDKVDTCLKPGNAACDGTVALERAQETTHVYGVHNNPSASGLDGKTNINLAPESSSAGGSDQLCTEQWPRRTTYPEQTVGERSCLSESSLVCQGAEQAIQMVGAKRKQNVMLNVVAHATSSGANTPPAPDLMAVSTATHEQRRHQPPLPASSTDAGDAAEPIKIPRTDEPKHGTTSSFSPETEVGGKAQASIINALPPVAQLLRHDDIPSSQGIAVQNILVFPIHKLKRKETILVAHTNGMIFAFSRPRQNLSDATGSVAELSAPGATFEPFCVDGSRPCAALLPTHADAASRRFLPESMCKLHSSDKFVACLTGGLRLYEVTVDRLKLHDGLNPTSTASKHEVQKPIQELFQERMPEVARLRAQAVAIHPRDNNLYAIACSDGSILIKCFHIESQHQTLISGTCRSSSSSDDHADADVTIQSPAHIIFAPHGGHLIVIKPCGSLNVTGQLRTATGAPSLMLCYVVPPTALTPGAAKPEHYDTCRDSYPDTEAGFVAYEKALRSEKKVKNDAKKDELPLWIDDINRNNRGDRLLPHDPLNVVHLPHGQPLVVVPKPSKLPKMPHHGFPLLDGKEHKECALLVWPTVAQIWQIAGGPMGLEHTFEAFGLTCATSLEWPAPCGTRTSTSYESIPMLSYWLIGASSGEVHVLTGDELKRPRSVPLHTLKSEPVLYRGPGGGVLLGSASCAHRTSIAISTIAVHTPQIKPDESRPKVEELTQSALIVGFQDGTLNQYHLVDVLGAAAQNESDEH